MTTPTPIGNNSGGDRRATDRSARSANCTVWRPVNGSSSGNAASPAQGGGAGVKVEFLESQTCCGQMHINTGYLEEAVPLVRRYVEAFDGYDAVVAPSASCAGTVQHYHHKIADERGGPALRDGVAKVRPKTYELTQFLTDVLGVEDVGAYFPHRVTYNPRRHSLRALGLGDRPYRLPKAVRGLTSVDPPKREEGYGFGGTSTLKNSDVSVAMGADGARGGPIAALGLEFDVPRLIPVLVQVPLREWRRHGRPDRGGRSGVR